MSGTLDPIGVARLVTRALDELSVRHTIGGSIASSLAGEPRSTLDIDIVAALEPHHVAPLLEAVDAAFYVDPPSLADRHWRDIVGIVKVRGPRLDREYLRAQAPVIDVNDLLDRALAQGAIADERSGPTNPANL